jgi:hypothetical protein
MIIGGTTFTQRERNSARRQWTLSCFLPARIRHYLYHDIQHVWLDNKEIYNTVRIVKLQRLVSGVWQDLPKCTDLLLSFKTIRIVGLAWDPLIDEAWPFAPPNDNFGYYRLDFWKQFGIRLGTPIPGLAHGGPPVHTRRRRR